MSIKFYNAEVVARTINGGGEGACSLVKDVPSVKEGVDTSGAPSRLHSHVALAGNG